MEYIITGLIAFVLGWFIGTLLLRVKLRIALETLVQQEIVSTIAKIPSLRTEVRSGIIFVYDSVTSAFMCQGTSLEDVAKKLNDICHVAFAQVNHADQYYMIVDGYVKATDAD